MKKIILLSIHSEYAQKILSGEKRFEFRKKVPSHNVSHIIFYATVPTAKIVCIAEIEKILSNTPNKIWDETEVFSGVTKEFFFSYYKNAKTAYAYKLGRVYRMKNNLKLDDPKIFLKSPQSFKYISKDTFNYIKSHAKKNPEPFKKIIFLAGVHGVGKTTFAQKYIVPMGFEIRTASALIKSARGHVQKNKLVKDADKNQAILIDEFEKIRKFSSKIILDGHLVLMGKNKKLERIPINVFRSLKISQIILLEIDSGTIRKRLLKRDKSRMSLEKCEKFILEERSHAIDVSENLKIPLLIIPDSDQSISFPIIE